MSEFLEKVLKDAQLLVGKKRNNENLAENILTQFKSLNSKIEDAKKVIIFHLGFPILSIFY